ncbi:MAG: DUF1501 domain-containing protein [Bacteroidetes bacterium]|nr:DUF1501 domain-containing protein [Bacteroidota bacterium]
MKRSTFLKTTGAALLPVTVNNNALAAMRPDSLLSRLAAMATQTDHVLVLIDLAGGNDGLNTVIPLDQYSNLSTARSNILIPSNKVLGLNGTTATGLHPSLQGLQQMYNNGKLHIVQSVGYPNQNYSHFRSQDIWFSASDSDQYVASGMAGRYLNMEYPGFPVGYPSTANPDPLGIQVGSLLTLMFQGPATNLGMAITDPNNVFNSTIGIPDTAPSTHAGEQLTYVRTIAEQTSAYSKTIKNAAAKVTSQKPYPDTDLANQLKTVARLVAGGLQTRVYMVSIGGFDTHSSQSDKTDPTKGIHANLMKTLNDAIVAFQADCEFLGIADRVVGATLSEFGRRIRSNDSMGTDHGAAAPVFIFGNAVNGGKMTGVNPTIPTTVKVDDNLPMQYDFRQIYATLLNDWFCLNDTQVENILLKKFNYLPLIAQGCNGNAVRSLAGKGRLLLSCNPNPFTDSAVLQYISSGQRVQISLMDYAGRMVETLVDTQMPAGSHRLEMSLAHIPAGKYLLVYQDLQYRQVVPVQKM